MTKKAKQTATNIRPPKPGSRPVNRATGKPSGSPAKVLLTCVDSDKLPKQRQNLFRRLEEDQQAFCRRVSGLLQRSTATRVLDIHRVGRDVVEFRQTTKYGDSAMRQMAFVIFGTEEGYGRLMTARKISEVWTEAELSRLLSEAARHGNEITEGHLKYLVALTGPHAARRKRLEEELVTRGMTTRQLLAKSRRRLSSSENTDPSTMLLRFYRTLEAFQATTAGAASSFDSLSEKLVSEDTADPKLTGVIQATVERLHAQGELIQAAEQQLRDILARCCRASEAEPTGESDQPLDDEDASASSSGAEMDATDEDDDTDGTDDTDETDDLDDDADDEAAAAALLDIPDEDEDDDEDDGSLELFDDSDGGPATVAAVATVGDDADRDVDR